MGRVKERERSPGDKRRAYYDRLEKSAWKEQWVEEKKRERKEILVARSTSSGKGSRGFYFQPTSFRGRGRVGRDVRMPT